MTPEQHSKLDKAVRALAIDLGKLNPQTVRIMEHEGFIDVSLAQNEREMVITTESQEITLVFGHGHRHAYQFWADNLSEAVEEIRTLALGIMRREIVSYLVRVRDEPVQGGFIPVANLDCLGTEGQLINVIGWNPRDDCSIRRAKP